MESHSRGRARGRARGRGGPQGGGGPTQCEVKENPPVQQRTIEGQFCAAEFIPAGATSARAEAAALVKSLPECMETMKIYNRAKRPGVGTKFMKKIALMVNYFAVKVPSGVFHQYDVDIEPILDKPKSNKKIPTRLPPELTKLIFSKLLGSSQFFSRHNPVYDGNKTLITRHPLPIRNGSESATVTIKEEDRDRSFIVTVKPTKMKHGCDSEIRLKDFHDFMAHKTTEFPQDAIKALDLVFKYGPTLEFHPAGRGIYFKPDPNNVPIIGGGREVWFGYSQSVRPTDWIPIVNIDLAATTFYTAGPAIKMVKEILGTTDLSRPLAPYQLKNLNDEIKGLKIKVNHLEYGRKYRVIGTSKQSAKELIFDMTDESGSNRKISVADYFRLRYRRHIEYQNLPCLQMQPKEKKIYVPIECCDVMPDQHCRKKLNENQTAKMIRETLKTPKQRFKEIEQNARITKQVSQKFLKEFDIEMETNCLQVEGGVLSPPQVVYSQNKTLVPKDGVWDLRNYQFLNGVDIPSWAIINYGSCRMPELQKLADLLKSCGRAVGMNFGRLECVEDYNRERNKGIKQVLKNLRQSFPGIKLVIVVLNTKFVQTGCAYSDVKQSGDTEIGIVTQCLKDANITNPKKLGPQLITNVCQKINAKLGGTNNAIAATVPNQQLKILESPVMFFGADVTHPAPGSHCPSIAAVVGSLDRHPSRFASRIKIQQNNSEFQSRVEIIIELKEMMISLLKQFKTETRHQPTHLVFYRDGVSEGQFAEVCSYEINEIKKACASLSATYKPKLTFVVVQKRHRTRFCPKFDKDAVGRAGNVPPGTVVDTKIISPVDFDYFLCSHYGLQGTSKPTHYTVLWDESGLSADDIQMLTYHLCYVYVRCTRSISIPSPVQYAHLAAFRARSHILKCGDFSSGSSQSSGSFASSPEFNEVNDAVRITENLVNSMYYA